MHKKDRKIIFVLFDASLFVRLLVLWMYPNAHLGSNAKEGFDYLSYHFLKTYSRKRQKEVAYVIPTRELRKRVCEKVR